MNPGHITLSPIIPLGWILLILLFGWTLVILQYVRIRRKLGLPRAFTLSLLRLIIFFILISFFLNPSLLGRKVHHVPPSLAILLDTSRSMGIPSSKGKGSRMDEARSVLNNGPSPLLRSLSERFEVRPYALGQSLRSIEAGELGSFDVSGERGDLNSALTALSGKHTFALLLSDGNLKWENQPSMGLPLFTYPVGNSEDYKDILIKAIKAPGLAFRSREVGIDVTLKVYGYKGLNIPVFLKEGNRLITVRSIPIKDSPREVNVSLSFTPEEIGNRSLSVSIAPQFGESLTAITPLTFLSG